MSERPTPVGLVAATRQLPPIARILARLQRLLADPNSRLEDVAELIRLDAALTTRVIQISNSTWFNRGAQSETILEAVNRIGFREIFHLVGIEASAAVVAQTLAAYGRDAMTTWRESVSCAFAAEILAQLLEEAGPAAYTVGLLHGIGRIPINHYVVSQAASEDAIKRLPDEGFPLDFNNAEYALLGFTQADVAATMLKKWEFTASVVEPIRNQYRPLSAEKSHHKVAAMLYAARLLWNVLYFDMEVPERAGEDKIFAAINLSRAEVLGYLPELKEQLSRANQITGAEFLH